MNNFIEVLKVLGVTLGVLLLNLVWACLEVAIRVIAVALESVVSVFTLVLLFKWVAHITLAPFYIYVAFGLFFTFLFIFKLTRELEKDSDNDIDFTNLIK